MPTNAEHSGGKMKDADWRDWGAPVWAARGRVWLAGTLRGGIASGSCRWVHVDGRSSIVVADRNLRPRDPALNGADKPKETGELLEFAQQPTEQKGDE